MELLSEYGGAYVSIRERLEHMYEELNTLKKKYEEAKLDVEVQMPHKFVVNSAFKAEKKSYPVRSLIVFKTLGLISVSIAARVGLKSSSGSSLPLSLSTSQAFFCFALGPVD